MPAASLGKAMPEGWSAPETRRACRSGARLPDLLQDVPQHRYSRDRMVGHRGLPSHSMMVTRVDARTGEATPMTNHHDQLQREILRLNGYATAQFGKCHEVPVWETSPAGPFNNWPSPGNGFEYFYGFIGGETNQWYPDLYENTAPVDPWGTPEQGYHLMPDLTDKAIRWVRQQKALTPDRPFFMYFAPGATHAPHHVPKEW